MMEIPEGATHYNKSLPFPYLRDGDRPSYHNGLSWIDYAYVEIGIRDIKNSAEIKTMQPKIDFSKAPEWATHVLTTGEKWNGSESIKGAIRFAIKIGDDYFATEHEGVRYVLGETSWRVIQEIPKAWNGEGLPPVGTVCDMLDDKNFFVEVEIIAIKSLHAFGWSEDRSMVYFSSNPDEFRPIQTPEQIEAKNREDFVSKATRIVGNKFANDLYNAGCRFQ